MASGNWPKANLQKLFVSGMGQVCALEEYVHICPMPLKSGKSKAAFESNIKTEVAAGKPVRQAVAIAYSKKRGGKKGKR